MKPFHLHKFLLSKKNQDEKLIPLIFHFALLISMILSPFYSHYLAWHAHHLVVSCDHNNLMESQ
jgi:hypothetical protein